MDFLIVFAIVCVLYVVTRWTLNRFERWLYKKYWGDKE
jgi:hypothetical protein